MAKELISARGLVRGPFEMARLAVAALRPFTGFATTSFHTAAPIRFGPYAAKLRLVPIDAGLNLTAITDYAGDIADRLADGPLQYDLEAQFFLAEDVTPIEDLTSAWPRTTAPTGCWRLTVPRQDVRGDAGQTVAAEVEADRFDPWNALAEHRPLGEVMRARKVAYYPSVQNR